MAASLQIQSEHGTFEKISGYLSEFKVDEVTLMKKSENAHLKRINNKSEFDKRIESYKPGEWMIANLSPLYCAQHGWYLYSNNMLQCVTCRSFLCTKLPSIRIVADAYFEFLHTLKEKIKYGHSELCQWRKFPSPLEYIQPTFSLQNVKLLAAEAVKLSSFGSNLPFINTNDILKKLNLNKEHVSALYEIGRELDDVKLIAGLLVLCGWLNNGKNSLRCNFCLRSIGLWNFYLQSEETQYLKYEGRRSKLQRKKQNETQKRKEEQLKLDFLRVRSTHSVDTVIFDPETENDEDMDFVELANTLEDQPDEESLLSEDHEGNESKGMMDSSGDDCPVNNGDKLFSVDAVVEEQEIRVHSDEDSKSNSSADDLWTEALQKHSERDADTNSSEVSDESDSNETHSKCNSLAAAESEPSNLKSDSASTEKGENSDKEQEAQRKKRRRPSESDSDVDSEDIQLAKKVHADGEEEQEEITAGVNVIRDLETESSSSSEEDLQDLKRAFDPLDEHRDWCGWLWRAELPSGEGRAPPGYLIIPPQLKCLLPMSSTSNLLNSGKYSKNIEGLKAIRSIVNQCTPPSEKAF